MHLPGEDAISKTEPVGTLLKFIDTGLFKWGARIFAGLCVLSSGWLFKEMRLAPAVICIVAAIIFGTAPKWVKNIFEISDESSLFSSIVPQNIQFQPFILGSAGCTTIRA